MEDSLFTTPRIWDHQVYATQNDQILSVFAYSMNLNPIAGNTGLVFEFAIQTGPGVTTYPLIINNLILAQSDMQNVATDSDFGIINILSSPIFRTDVSQVLFFNFVEDTLYSTVEFYNDGSEILEMEFNIIGEQFFILENIITIEQNSNLLFTIGCTPTGEVGVEGILNTSTNDPNNSSFEILLLNILQYSMTSTEYDFGNLMIDSLYSRSIGFENFTEDSVNIQLTLESDVFSLTNNTLELGLGHSEIPIDILSAEYGFYSDTVFVTVNDSIPLSSIALNVNFYENYTPVINISDTLQLNEDTPTIFEYSVEDPNDDVIVVDIQFDSEYLSIEYTDTTILVVPEENWNGETLINIFASDGNLITESIVDIFVLPLNDAPIVIIPMEDLQIDEDSENLFITLEPYFSDVDINSNEDSLFYSIGDIDSELISASILSNSILIVEFIQDVNGIGHLEIIATDLTGEFISSGFNIEIIPVNDIPFIFDVNIISNEDVELEISFDGDDVDGDILEYFVVNGPFNGMYSNGVYTPNDDYFGNDSLFYIAFDGELYSDTASVFIDIIESNDAPIVEDLNIELDEDTTVEIEFIGSDIEGDELSYIIYEEPTHGDVEGNIYIPHQDYFGNDSLFYIANDGDLNSEPAIVLISILPINDPPIISDIENQIIEEDSTLQIILSSINVDEDILIYSAISDNGSVFVTIIDDTLNITLEENWFGESIIFVTVSDGEFETSTEFTLVVNPVNDLPSEFHLTSPEDESEMLLSDMPNGIEFIWSESFDVEGDTLIYLFTITDTLYNELLSQEIDITSITVNDTTLLNILQTLDTDTLLTKWFVSVSDGVDITESVEEFNLTIIDDITLGIDDLTLLPTKYNLSQNYPNPFNPITTIEFALPKRTKVKLVVYNLQGREIYTLINNNLNVGYHSVQWNGINKFGNQVSSGVYIYMLETSDYGKIQKMVLLK